MRPTVHLVGRFPPPIDGQSLATARLARMLQSEYDVLPFDTAFKAQSLTPSGFFTQLRTLQHYLHLKARLRTTLAAAPASPVLWGAISPTPLGHARDMIATVPHFCPRQRVIAIAHRGGFHRIFQHPATARSARHLAQRVNRFVFLSDVLAAQVAPWIPDERISIIPYTVEPCASTEEVAAKHRARTVDRPLNLLYLSNMIPSKGYLDTLEGAAEAHARGVQLKLTYVGRWNSDNDQRSFLARVQALGMEHIVTHHGAVQDRDEINTLHRNADIFLLPTYYSEEAQPISIIEALSAATPVIVTRHSGITDMVRADMETRFVPPQNPSAIASAIENLASVESWHTASQHARARYEQRFSEEAVRAQWLELLAKDN